MNPQIHIFLAPQIHIEQKQAPIGCLMALKHRDCHHLLETKRFSWVGDTPASGNWVCRVVDAMLLQRFLA